MWREAAVVGKRQKGGLTRGPLDSPLIVQYRAPTPSLLPALCRPSRTGTHVQVLHQRLRPGGLEVGAPGQVSRLLQEGRVARAQLAGVNQHAAPLRGRGQGSWCL